MPDQVPDADSAPIVIEHHDHRRDVEGDAVVASENPVKTLEEMLNSFPGHFEFSGVRVNDEDVCIPDVIGVLTESDKIDHVRGVLTTPNGEEHVITHAELDQFYADPDVDMSADTEDDTASDSESTLDEKLKLDVGEELDDLEDELSSDDYAGSSDPAGTSGLAVEPEDYASYELHTAEYDPRPVLEQLRVLDVPKKWWR